MATDTNTTTCSAAQAAQIEELKRLIYRACHAPDDLTWDEATLVDDIVALLDLDA
jgi:hypothetical protein